MGKEQLQNDKLFRDINDRLNDYEAPSNGMEWDAMSRSLENVSSKTRFKFKITLSSILIFLGVSGSLTLGYVFIAPSFVTSENVKLEPQRKNLEVAKGVVLNKPIPAPIQEQESATIKIKEEEKISINKPIANELLNSTRVKKTIKVDKNGLKFGDQIDPRKGFIYNTTEKTAITNKSIKDSTPNLFYDTDNGDVKKLIINKDSAGNIKLVSPDKLQSDSAN